MQIITFKDKYRDDLIFMILEAKNALGRVPGLNPDLLDIKANYLDKGNMFWIALDDNDRVIGSIGYSTNENQNEVTLHRLFIKYNLKRKGIGTTMLTMAEEYIKSQGKDVIYVNLGSGKEWFESRNFYAKHNYIKCDENKMKKIINDEERKHL